MQMKKYLFILLLASCDEEMHPKCQEMANHCKTLLRQMDQAKTAQERWQLEQFYLSEKHDLEACIKSH